MHDRRALSTIIELYIANRSVNSIVVRIPKDIIFTERKLKQITQPATTQVCSDPSETSGEAQGLGLPGMFMSRATVIRL